jgi:hypothetical protein
MDDVIYFIELLPYLMYLLHLLFFLVGRGLLLHQVDTLTLENVEQCLTALQDFHVRRFRLLDGLVVLGSGLLLALKRFVNLRQALGQDS